MPRKTAAQKARVAAKPSATNATSKKPNNAPHLALHGDSQPPSKKAKIGNEKSNATKDVTPERQQALHIISKSKLLGPGLDRRTGQPRPSTTTAPPKALPSKTKILPPETDDLKLRASYDIHTVNVATSSKIESKVTSVLLSLRDGTRGERHDRKVVVALSSNAKAANKSISIAEIAMREFVKDDDKRKVFQYNGCWTRLETHVPKQKPNDSKESEKVDLEHTVEMTSDEESDDAFEDLEEARHTKVRNATCMVIFLSTEPVMRLKELYGEQIHDRDKR